MQFNHVRIVRFTGSFLVATPTAVLLGVASFPSNTAAYLTFGPDPSPEGHSQGGLVEATRWRKPHAWWWPLWSFDGVGGQSIGDLA